MELVCFQFKAGQRSKRQHNGMAAGTYLPNSLEEAKQIVLAEMTEQFKQ